jgi:hypothetical protein
LLQKRNKAPAPKPPEKSSGRTPRHIQARALTQSSPSLQNFAESGLSGLPLNRRKKGGELFQYKKGDGLHPLKKSRAKGSTNLSPGHFSNNPSFSVIHRFNYCIHLESSQSTIPTLWRRPGKLLSLNTQRTTHHNHTQEHSTQ